MSNKRYLLLVPDTIPKCVVEGVCNTLSDGVELVELKNEPKYRWRSHNKTHKDKNGKDAERGEGFGDKVFRTKGMTIQVSFCRPCKESYAVKGFGYKWNHKMGYWEKTFDNMDDIHKSYDILKQLGLKSIVE